jgi:carboxyl-terminal processing protease
MKSRLSRTKIGINVVFSLLLGLSNFTLADQKQQPDTLPIKDVQRFTTAISEIKSYYVTPISDQQLFENAIRGMVGSLDPHSSYLDTQEFQDLTATTEGSFGGVGLEVTMEDGIIKVVTALDDSPAQRAGLKPGDLIIKLDNTIVKGLTLEQAVDKIRGPKGTALNLLVIRKGTDHPLTFKLTRDVVKLKSVTYKMLEPNYGYIRISQFQAPTDQNVKSAIEDLNKQAGGHLKGLVLDLRNNPGGLLDSAVAVSNLFLDSSKLGKNKIIVYTKGRVPGADSVSNANGVDLLNGAPMVVLINEGTASAAEIVAGALQDHKRAVLMGSTSFGKGSVQTVFPLDETTGLKLTTALYYTPNGRSIQAKGITPDVPVGDVKVEQSAKNGDLDNIDFHEADLSGHLQNGNKNVPAEIPLKIPGLPSALKTLNQSLIYSDYPLYEAVNLLKALTMARS